MSEETIREPDLDWERRAQGKMESGEWAKPPFSAELWFRKPVCGSMFDDKPCYCSGGVLTKPDHYLHIEDAQCVFYASVQHASRHRVTIMRAGRYLQKYYGDVLSADEIEKWAGAVNAMRHGLQLATTPSEIVRVYTAAGPANDSRSSTGSQPCMSHPASVYSCTGHPVEVYGAGDLAVAYAMDVAAGEVVGRALVWPKRKVYGRLYGNATMFGRLLREAGYAADEEKDGFDGARLLCVKQDGEDGEDDEDADGSELPSRTVKCPYLDSNYSVVVADAKHLRMVSGHSGEGQYDCQRTDGLATLGVVCALCDNIMRSGNGVSMRQSDGLMTLVCNGCAEDLVSCFLCSSMCDGDSAHTVIGSDGREEVNCCAWCYRKYSWVDWLDSEILRDHLAKCNGCNGTRLISLVSTCPCLILQSGAYGWVHRQGRLRVVNTVSTNGREYDAMRYSESSGSWSMNYNVGWGTDVVLSTSVYMTSALPSDVVFVVPNEPNQYLTEMLVGAQGIELSRREILQGLYDNGIWFMLISGGIEVDAGDDNNEQEAAA